MLQKPKAYISTILSHLEFDTYAHNVGLLLKTAPKFLFPILIANAARLAVPTYKSLYNDFSNNAYYNGTMYQSLLQNFNLTCSQVSNLTDCNQKMEPAIQQAITLDLSVVNLEGTGITTTVAVASVTLFLVYTAAHLLWLMPKKLYWPRTEEQIATQKAEVELENAISDAAKAREKQAYAIQKEIRQADSLEEIKAAVAKATALANEAEAAATAALSRATALTVEKENSTSAIKARAAQETTANTAQEVKTKSAEMLEGQNTLEAAKEIALIIATNTLTAVNAAEQAEQLHANDSLVSDSPLTQKAKAINEHSDQSTKYGMIASTIGLGVGIYLMSREAKPVQEELHCTGFPLWRILRGDCDTESLLLLLSFDSYIWSSVSVAGLSTYLFLMTVGPLLGHLLGSQFRQAISQLNSRYDHWLNGNDRRQWLYQDLCFHWLLPAMVTLITLAAVDSTALSNKYVQQNYCGDTIWEVLISVFKSEHTNDQICDGSQRALALSTSFLGNFELGRVWPIYFSYRVVTHMIGSGLTFVINHLQPAEFKKHLNERALQQRYWLNKEMAAASTWSGFGVILAGIIAFSPAETLGNDMLANGLNAWQKISTTIFGGDPITVIIREQIIPACNHTLNHMYFQSLIGDNLSECDPILVSRAFSGFISPFWLSVTTLAITTFALRMYTPMLFTALEKLFARGLKPVTNPANIAFNQCASLFSAIRNTCCPKREGGAHLLRDFTGDIDGDGQRVYAAGTSLNYGTT